VNYSQWSSHDIKAALDIKDVKALNVCERFDRNCKILQVPFRYIPLKQTTLGFRRES